MFHCNISDRYILHQIDAGPLSNGRECGNLHILFGQGIPPGMSVDIYTNEQLVNLE